MLTEKLSDSMWVLLGLCGVILLVVLAGWAGLWLGERSVNFAELAEQGASKKGFDKREGFEGTGQRKVDAPPFFFYANVPPGGDWNVALEEIRLAAAAGLHQYVVPVALSWEETGPVPDAALDRIETVLAVDPQATVLLYVRLDPPESWRAAHPESVMVVGDATLPYASPASEAWLKAARKGLTSLMDALGGAESGRAVSGCFLGCLEEGRWYQSAGYDTSEVNTAAFRRWLALRYEDDAALQAAWADETVTLDTAMVPPMPDTTNTHEVFFPLPQVRRHVDFREYTSAQTADSIAALAAQIKETTKGAASVIVPYGHALELERNGAGHYALMRIIDSDIDGFASPVSYYDRGIGGVGGPMGPIDSAALHGKRWYLIDDTRTGIARDPASGAVTRLEGLRLEDVFNVQARNFAAALSHDLGLIWSDPQGQGWLCDPDMWERFGRMYAVRKECARPHQTPEWDDRASDAWPAPDAYVAVVVDEASRFYQQCDTRLNNIVLLDARDCILRAGVPTRFFLLQDILEERTPQAAVYLFLNAFRLDAESRERLHEILAGQRAAAIWLYAPGYIAGAAAPENVAATTRMGVKAFEKPSKSGSIYQLAGTWIGKNEEYGEAIEWAPLFYVDDNAVDVIATYRDSGKASAAIAFLEEGWASIFLAEPAVTPGLLREILHILGVQIYCQGSAKGFFDAAYFGPNLLGIHAKEAGERQVDLGPDRLWDIQDLLAPEIGWLQKSSFMLPMKAGETRLLKLTAVDAPPEEE